MSFKFKKFYVEGGSAEFPTGTTYELRRSRSELLLTKCAQAIIDCDCGWQLDTNKSATMTSYTDIPDLASSSYPYPALFLINTISGCKLFMSYFGHDNISTYGIKNWGNNSLILHYNTTWHCGLCMSIIPADSPSNFGNDPTQDSFMPASATRINGTFFRNNISFSSIKFAAACNPDSGRYYAYFLGATPYCVCVCAETSTGTLPVFSTPVYATGRIFDILAHESDNTAQSKYGTIVFKFTSGDYEGGWLIGNSTNASSPSFTIYNASPIYTPGFSTVSGSVYTAPTCGAVCKADGSWLLGGDNSSKNVIFYTEGFNQLCSNIHLTTDSTTRWVRLAMASVSSSPTDNGIITGDGFKGYLDTNLFRVGIASKGSFFDNNKFLCPSNNYNLLLGVDPNSESPFLAFT